MLGLLLRADQCYGKRVCFFSCSVGSQQHHRLRVPFLPSVMTVLPLRLDRPSVLALAEKNIPDLVLLYLRTESHSAVFARIGSAGFQR